MPDFDYIVFDLGQVLALVDESIAAREIAALCGRPEAEVALALFSVERKVPLETGAQTWSEFSRMVREELGLKIADDRFREIFTSVLSPHEPIFNLVRSLGRSYSLACCSNTSGPHWDNMRATVPVVEMFRPRVLSFEVGAMKPSPEIYRALVTGCRADPGKILFIDDNAANVAGARDYGIEALQFTCVDRLVADLEALGVRMM